MGRLMARVVAVGAVLISAGCAAPPDLGREVLVSTRSEEDGDMHRIVCVEPNPAMPPAFTDEAPAAAVPAAYRHRALQESRYLGRRVFDACREYAAGRIDANLYGAVLAAYADIGFLAFAATSLRRVDPEDCLGKIAEIRRRVPENQALGWFCSAEGAPEGALRGDLLTDLCQGRIETR